MSDGSTTASPSDSSSGPPRPGLSSVTPACWATHLAAVITALSVAVPLGLSLPKLIELAFNDCGQWKPLAVALAVFGFLAAPVPTLALLGRMIPGRSNNTKE